MEKNKRLKKRKYFRRAVEKPSNLYIRIDSDFSADTSTSYDARMTDWSASSSYRNTSSNSPASEREDPKTTKIPGKRRCKYKLNFHKLFSTQSEEFNQNDLLSTENIEPNPEILLPVESINRRSSLLTVDLESDNEKFLSTTVTPCSSLPDLIIEPESKQKKYQPDDLNMKDWFNLTKDVKLSHIKNEWKTNYPKFDRKYFIYSYCSSDSNSNIRGFCQQCTTKAEDEMMVKMKEQHLKEKKASKRRWTD